MSVVQLNNRNGDTFVGDYVIFSMWRSSTTTFCSFLNSQPHTNCMYELLNFGPNSAGSKMAHKLEYPIGGKAPVETQVEFLTKARRHVCGTDPKCNFGFKVFPYHVHDPASILRADTTCIIYRRNNVTAQYLSYKRATTTGCWGSTPAIQERDCDSWSPEIDGVELEKFNRTYENWYSRAEAACKGHQTFQFTMEEWLQIAQPPPSPPPSPPFSPLSYPWSPPSFGAFALIFMCTCLCALLCKVCFTHRRRYARMLNTRRNISEV